MDPETPQLRHSETNQRRIRRSRARLKEGILKDPLDPSPRSKRKSSLQRGVSRSAGFHSDYEYFHSLESGTCSICRKYIYSVVARTNEHGMPAIPPDPLVESSPF